MFMYVFVGLALQAESSLLFGIFESSLKEQSLLH